MDSYAPLIKKMFRDLGCDVRSDMTHKFATEGDPGRSDLVVMYKNWFCYVEMKDDPAGLKLSGSSGWSIQQRDWMRDKVENGSEGYLTLIAGKHRPDAAKEELSPKRAWIIPYHAADWAARTVLGLSGQQSIPYRAEKGMNKIIQQQHLDCITLFSIYEVYWQNGGWVIPEEHNFAQKIEMYRRRWEGWDPASFYDYSRNTNSKLFKV